LRSSSQFYHVFFITATQISAIYTLSLHDALPICVVRIRKGRIEEPAVLRASVVHRSPELVRRPVADPGVGIGRQVQREDDAERRDRKSTRLNSSHVKISYAVFCLKKKKQINNRQQ